MEFDFNLIDTYSPEIVIREALKEIEEATKGYVIGKIDSYSGPIKSYKKSSGLASISLGLATKDVDIQEDLGVLDDEDNKFEVFLQVKGLEHYKYRMMFLEYGTVSYPATVVLNEELAMEYSGKGIELFRISSMAELNDMMEKIINSKTMFDLIQSLINEALRQEKKRGLPRETQSERWCEFFSNLDLLL